MILITTLSRSCTILFFQLLATLTSSSGNIHASIGHLNPRTHLFIWARAWQIQQTDLCSQRRLGSAFCSKYSLCVQWEARYPMFLHADSEDWFDWADAAERGIVHLKLSTGVYFPRESASQIHCYMTRLDPNPSINPGDAVAALPPPPAKPRHPISYLDYNNNSAVLNGIKPENLHTREEFWLVSSRDSMYPGDRFKCTISRNAAEAQADLSLHCVNMAFCWFSHIAAHFFLNDKKKKWCIARTEIQ